MGKGGEAGGGGRLLRPTLPTIRKIIITQRTIQEEIWRTTHAEESGERAITEKATLSSGYAGERHRVAYFGRLTWLIVQRRFDSIVWKRAV
jgi:hypothetical protein